MTIATLVERPRVRYVLIASAILGLIIGLDTLRVHLQFDPFADVHAYYDAGARLNAGEPLYVQPSTTDDADFYRYPPLLAIAFRPLALLPFEAAALIWEAILVVLFVLTIIRMDWHDRWTWIILGWLAAPIGWALAVGQAQVVITFLLAVGSPAAVAVAAHIKLLPALVAIYWIGRGQWRRLGWFVAWAVALLGVSFVLEPAGTVAYLSFTDLAQVGAVRNLSPYAFAPWLWAVLVIALALIAFRLARTRWGWAMAVAFSVFASPRLLMYMFSTLAAGKAGPRDPSGEDKAESDAPTPVAI